ncbi:uncharacterized protein LOC131160178 [Malania oleifera]|uniref:uncharacterized protein LOC131160178 n=1 Tax=Malania oleifera TaxID=397392 RepID=UPI0025ADB994|nr:uncharacterized protein LOC131160178 [Malania oleifera]XP_057971549.1 uncharacterized protein LOC131160178 [Malania oleifera]
MRGSIGRRLPALGSAAKPSQIASSSSLFSTSSSSSSGGGGRGRGRGSSSGPPRFDFCAPGKPDSGDSKPLDSVDTPFPSGLGHGRGKPAPSAPIIPSFSSWNNGVNAPPSAGRGRANPQVTAQPTESHPQDSQVPKKPIFFLKEEVSELNQKTQLGDLGRDPEETSSSELPSSMLLNLSPGGAGRGKPAKGSADKIQEENRHIQARQATRPMTGRRGVEVQERTAPSAPRMSREEAVKKAVGILSRGEEGGRGSGFGVRGRRGGARGRGMQGWRGRGRWSGGRGRDLEDDSSGLFLGDNADGEKLAKRIGIENMNKLVEGFEEMSGRVLPSPVEDAYLDALHTNYMIECEPEYLMEEFGTNPDIDEKPPIPLRDALEKMKPFLMAYEGIQTQEEWEEAIEETMEKVPCIKELVDYYSGPDRVTAKKQHVELERVANTVPESAPVSIKQFANRAVLSLQSNPGWGFDKKCQFMDKLVREVSQHYK